MYEFCAVLSVSIGQCTKYFAYENFPLYSMYCCMKYMAVVAKSLTAPSEYMQECRAVTAPVDGGDALFAFVATVKRES